MDLMRIPLQIKPITKEQITALLRKKWESIEKPVQDENMSRAYFQALGTLTSVYTGAMDSRALLKALARALKTSACELYGELEGFIAQSFMEPQNAGYFKKVKSAGSVPTPYEFLDYVLDTYSWELNLSCICCPDDIYGGNIW